jgi:hypothetical protein
MASLKFYNTTTNQWEVIKTDSINGVIPNNQTWTAIQGQTTFTIPNGTIADPKLLSVYVDGKIRSDITMPNNTTFQFLTNLNSGQQVYAEWFEVSVPATAGHHATHELFGNDAIDVTKLKNYAEQIQTPIGNAQTNITNVQTDLTNHKNNTSNPHGVTASQVGAYSKTEADTLLKGKISGYQNYKIDIDYGIFFTNGGSHTTTSTITFSNAFSSPPYVIPCNITQVTSYGDVIYYPFIYGVTPTGFNVRIISTGDLGIQGDPKNIFMAFLAIGN